MSHGTHEIGGEGVSREEEMWRSLITDAKAYSTCQRPRRGSRGRKPFLVNPDSQLESFVELHRNFVNVQCAQQAKE